MVHSYNPNRPSPVKPPPKNFDPEQASHDNSLLSMLPSAAIKSLIPRIPSMKWMGEAASMFGESGTSAFKYAEKAAPYVMDAAEMLAPFFLDEEEVRVSAA